MRHKLLTCVALTLVLAACTSTLDCKPCLGTGYIDIRPVRAGSTGTRICFDGQCGALQPIPTEKAGLDESVSFGSEIYDASSITLELYNGKQFLKSYTGQIDVKRPKPRKDCSSCGSIRLAPADDNTLVRVN
ncbi:hypothetical protein AB0P21_22675 [Kribbella sp. NPDC056861]|uniref:hypothetical protein n=1 Tax=Kribbella sp. NPDC056861 TaxID=3154857 RepID=UPI00342B55FE